MFVVDERVNADKSNDSKDVQFSNTLMAVFVLSVEIDGILIYLSE